VKEDAAPLNAAFAGKNIGREKYMATKSNANAIMQCSFLSAFANDGTIDAGELAMLGRPVNCPWLRK
jgi:hypothetical protein